MVFLPDECIFIGWMAHVLVVIGWMAHIMTAIGWMAHILTAIGWMAHELVVIGWMAHELAVNGWIGSEGLVVGGWRVDLYPFSWRWLNQSLLTAGREGGGGAASLAVAPALVRSGGVQLLEGFERLVEGAQVVPHDVAHRLQVVRVPLEFVPNNDRVEDPGVYALGRQVRGHQRPLGVELDRLRL